MASLSEIRSRLRAIGQEHLLTFYDELPEASRQSLLNQIESLDLERVPGWVERYVTSKPDLAPAGRIEPPSYYPADPDDPEAPYDAKRFRKLGEELVRAGQVAAFCVAGGQGTRLGWDGPKGTFPATPVLGKPLFQVFAEYIHAVQARYNCVVPFYVMTSPLNHGDTVAFFNANRYFGLDPANVQFFTQGVMPSFDKQTGRILLAAKDQIAVSPDGHGGSLKALHVSGALADMRARGIQHISYLQVDNPLVKVVDPLFLGLHVGAPDSSGEMSSKMVLKAGPDEKVGNFCRVDGKTAVIEYSDLPDALAHDRDEHGRLRFRAGSIAIHCIGVDFVERLNAGVDGFALPFHRAEKKVPCIDLETGERLEPTTPNAVKLEMFVFDALPLCESSIILETRREDEFAPIKNASGVDSAESSKRLQSERHARWLEAVGVRVPRDAHGHAQAVVEISPITALDPEELRGVDLPESITAGEAIAL